MYIKRTDAIEYLIRLQMELEDMDVIDIKWAINDIPAANVTEVAVGKWLPSYHDGKFKGAKCSVCGKFKRAHSMKQFRECYQFCHRCGAKMECK